ncbi:hypothetical protein EV175_005143 [Coemansia sp. RSA 1933]|nr:hypothetical protein EV175_005143 [Coemansia sp. RSA 1933]
MTHYTNTPESNNNTAVVVHGRSVSDASLADFLRCTAPYQPSFMDKKKPHTKQPAPTVKTDWNQGTEQLANARSEEYKEQIRMGERESVETGGDAEFLSHALCHFAAFQPHDFAPPVDLDEPKQRDNTNGGLLVWSFIRDMFDDYSHTITFY